MKRVINYLILVFIVIVCKGCFTFEKHRNIDLYCEILNLSDSIAIINCSYKTNDTFYKINDVTYTERIERRKNVLLKNDSCLIGPFPCHKCSNENAYNYSFAGIFSDTIFITTKKGIAIKKDIYDKKNWSYLLIEKSNDKENDQYIFKFVIYNEDLK